MNRQKADSMITEFLPKIYGFAMKKAFSYDEAEDLCGDIIQEVYLTLLGTEEIFNPEGYIWRISTHVYAKYVARKKRHQGVSIDGCEIPFYEAYDSLLEDTEADIARLRREIAFLTKNRRKIIYMFYYEEKSISCIADCLGIPEGTVKWHLNKARNELKEGFKMERKTGTLGISPIMAMSMGHSGSPDTDGGDTYKYLGDKLNLNIVYSVYHEPRNLEEISEELGVTPVFLEDRVNYLEANGFLVRTAGGRFTTYVNFSPRSYSLEQEETELRIQQKAAEILAAEYFPLIRQAMADRKDVYLPGGNRELLEAAAVYYGICHNFHPDNRELTEAASHLPRKQAASIEHSDLSRYYVKTLEGGCFIPFVVLNRVRSDPEYQPQFNWNDYSACGDMNRGSDKYPLTAWSVDTKFCSRTGSWQDNLASDYEYLYEWISGILPQNTANADKIQRLRDKRYISEDGSVDIIVMKRNREDFFSEIPAPAIELREQFIHQALEYAMMDAKNYPPQMQDLVINWGINSFIGPTTAIMVLDILYGNGTLKPLTDKEKITSQLIMFSDILP